MRTFSENFLRHINVTEDCWLWTGFIQKGGYASFSFNIGGVKYTKMAHRVAYELFIAPIPEGLELDHLCLNKSCVNPSHLEPVTPQENSKRAVEAGSNHNANKVQCPSGHPYDVSNTRITPLGKRMCRACHRDKMRFGYYPYLQRTMGVS